MDKTIQDFIQFISEDALMLGLCCAIVFLVIVFILVLCFGGKKKENKEDAVEDNTTSLLAVSPNDEPLRSTQEFAVNTLTNEENAPTQKIPTIESIEEDEMQKNAPISVTEAIDLKNKREEEARKETIQIPVVNDLPDIPVNVPVMPETEDELNFLNDAKPEEPKVETNPNTQPFSSVYVNSGDGIPTVKDDEISKTQIIRHIPVEEQPAKVESDDLDDIDLPKLNKNDETSVLNALSGESFNIR